MRNKTVLVSVYNKNFRDQITCFVFVNATMNENYCKVFDKIYKYILLYYVKHVQIYFLLFAWSLSVYVRKIIKRIKK